MEDIINFNIPKKTTGDSIIMVVGVGGGGGNAVNHMYEQGIKNVSFMICNTDKQALAKSTIQCKIHLGEKLTEGLGAGDNPERGSNAARESIDQIKAVFKSENTKMVFITAGMGGGTGTGGSPVIAQAAQEMGILTVAIVTLPFKTEGRRRAEQAKKGVEELKKHADSLLLVNNESIREMYGDLPITEAFGRADNILTLAAKGISEIIMEPHIVNVDFADVSTVMRKSGLALMGSARSGGSERVTAVANAVLASPLLNHNDIKGAKNILINIAFGEKEVSMDEVCDIIDIIQDRAGNDANLIWGTGKNDALESDEIELTIVATGFDNALGSPKPKNIEVIVPLENTVASEGFSNDIVETEPESGFSSNNDTLEEVEQQKTAVEHIIDEYSRTPAYLRRRSRMAAIPKTAVTKSKIDVKSDDNKAAGQDQDGGSLFGND